MTAEMTETTVLPLAANDDRDVCTRTPEVSIVMPCLDEAQTVGTCINKARHALDALGIAGEIIVADNGSTDGSAVIARSLGARVVDVPFRGYGNALRAGIGASRGRYVVMADADDSYDFSEIARFIGPLREGYDLVMGNRFRGGIQRGAMPWLHRWIGNPLLSWIGRLLFRAPVADFHCGMRAFSRAAYERLQLQTGGMEFASEMVAKSALLGLRITEIPITLHQDGRSRPAHLRTWRDGWRHLRFMLLFSPGWLFLIPGLVLMGVGLSLSIVLLPGTFYVGELGLDVHTLLAAVFAVITGYQLVVFSAFTKLFAVREGLHPRPRVLDKLPRWIALETGVVVGLVLAITGAALFAAAVGAWWDTDFGALDPRIVMRRLIPACGLVTVGLQTIFASFFLGILGLRGTASSRPQDSGR